MGVITWLSPFTPLRLGIDVPGRFLFNNYRQALATIKDLSPAVEHMKAELHVSDADIQQWLEDERKFLKDLKDEPEERLLEVAYVEALIGREDAECVIKSYT